MKFNEKEFKDEKLNIDNNSYTKCVFINCELEYSGGAPPSLVNCELTNSKFTFSDQAANTMNFMKAMYHGGFKPVVEDTFKNIKKNG